MAKAALFFVLALALCAGCTSVSVRKPPKLDLRKYTNIFVLTPFNENHHIDEYFVDEIRKTGRTATSGPMTMMPDEAQVVLAYDTRWTWDFTTYLLELDVSLRQAHTNKLMADGRYYQPSATPKSPEVAVREIVKRMFPKE